MKRTKRGNRLLAALLTLIMLLGLMPISAFAADSVTVDIIVAQYVDDEWVILYPENDDTSVTVTVDDPTLLDAMAQINTSGTPTYSLYMIGNFFGLSFDSSTYAMWLVAIDDDDNVWDDPDEIPLLPGSQIIFYYTDEFEVPEWDDLAQLLGGDPGGPEDPGGPQDPGGPGGSGGPEDPGEDPGTPNVFTSWYDTSSAFFAISTAEQLAGLAEIVNGTADGINWDDFSGKAVALAADIDLGEVGEWTPIGSTSANSFMGTFDGAGHTISGLYIPSGSYEGLFGYIGAGGTVQDLTVTDSSLTGTEYIGLVAGTNAGLISGVVVKDSAVSSAGANVGMVGGIAGQNAGIITASANIGTALTFTQSSGSDRGAGGIAGQNTGEITLSFNNANIVNIGSEIYGYYGGIAGVNSGTIDSCYNTGDIARGWNTGGIAGNNSQPITNCYNIGTIGSGGSSRGEIFGSGGSALNCYYLDSAGAATSNGIAKTETELKALASELGGAFDSDLTPNINNGYPILKWQNPDTIYSITLRVVPADAIVVLTDSDGEIAPDSSIDGVYIFGDLAAGNYSYSVSKDDGDYAGQTGAISLGNMDVSRTITLARNLYEVLFNVTPGDVIVSIAGEGYDLSKPTSGGAASFMLPVGNYAYSAEKFGYVSQTGSVTVAKDTGSDPVALTLAENTKRSLTFNVAPDSAAIILTHATQGAQTPVSGSTYSLYEGETYSYTVRLSGYVTVKGTVTVGSDDDIITIELIEGIASWDGVTATEPPLVDGVYQIADGEHLAWFRDKVNSELVLGSGSNSATVANNSTSSKSNAILLYDIDLDGYEWKPIGTYKNDGASFYGVPYGYAGTFDGNCKTISGLSITTGADGSGLFGVVFGDGVVKNLVVEGSITVGQYSGGIAGFAQGGGSSSSITPAPATGATITNCISYVDITVNRNLSNSNNNIMVGGIVGCLNNHAYDPSVGLIEYCMNYGTITGGPNSYIGGIVGNAYTGIAIRYCGNEGIISGEDEIGGIAGDHANILISNCYNTGSITGTGNYVGGISGYSNRVTLDCYNTGTVSGRGQAGGIVGRLVGTNGLVNGSYNTGAVSSSGSGGTGTCGAIVGEKGEASKTVFSSFYLEGTAAAGIGSNANANDGVAAMTAADLQKLSTVAYLGSAFVQDEGGYPLLRWQTGGTDIAVLFEVDREGAAVIVTDSGDQVVPPAEGAYCYLLAPGSYAYEISKDGYMPVSGMIADPPVDTVIIVAMFPASSDDLDIAAAKAAVEAALAAAAVTQADISGAAGAKAAVEAIIAALDLGDVAATVTGGAYTAAATGTGSNPGGTDGSYAFAVALNKGDGIEQTYSGLLRITATPYASPDPVTVSIFYGNANEGGFPVILLDYSLDPGLSEAYGFVDEYDGSQATMVDAIVAANLAYYGEGFASHLIISYGSVSKLFDDTSFNFTFYVNGGIPGEGELYYTVTQMALEDGDEVRFFVMASDDYNNMDSYVWFEADGDAISELTVAAGEETVIALMGYDGTILMWTGESYLRPFEDIAVVDMLVTDEAGGYLSAYFDGTGVEAMSYGDGLVTLVFDAPGTYYLSTVSSALDYVLPAWLIITVTDGAVTPPPADKTTLNNRIAEAQGKLAGAVVGTAPGQYPQSALDALSASISVAQAVADKTDAAQSEVDNAVTALTNAIAVFDAEKVPEPSTPGTYLDAMNSALTFVLLQVSNPDVAAVGGEWAVLARARDGKDDVAWSDLYLTNLRAAIAEAYSVTDGKVILDNNRPTENERVILALTALGYDASNFEGYDFVSPLVDMTWVQKQGANSNIFALIALNSKPYSSVSAEPLLAALLSAQHTDNGWGQSSVSTVDITAMAIQALAPYYGQRAAATTAVDNALAWLGAQTISDVEGNVQAIVALSSLGIDAMSYVDDLLTYYDEASGGFRRLGFIDLMATEQAAYALVAYDRYLNGSNALYDMSDAGAPIAPPDISDAEAVDSAAAALTWGVIAGTNTASDNVRTNLNLPGIGENDVAIAWASDNLAYVSNNGAVTRPGYAEGNKTVTLTATVTKGAASATVAFAITVTAQNPPSSAVSYAKISVVDPGATGSQTRVYFAESQLALDDGETAFSLLQRTGLAIVTATSSQYAGAYVVSLNGFGEFSDGPLSGWMYKVNGVFPGYSASQFELKDGDVVEWVYTRSLGGDVGGGSSAGGGAPGNDDKDEGTEEIGETETPLAPIVWTNQFGDISQNVWYFEAVKFAFENGLMRGVSDTDFAPRSNLTRAQLITILARSAGVDTDGGSTWFELAVAWGMENGITDGTSLGGDVTREQFVTMLFRYANEVLGLDTSNRADLSGFDDVGSVSDWAAEAMSWAVAEGLVIGRTDSALVPGGNTTRAEAATLLMRFLEMAKAPVSQV